MKALVLGLGLQGKAVIHDLSQSGLVDEIIGADMDISSAEAFLKRGVISQGAASAAQYRGRIRIWPVS